MPTIPGTGQDGGDWGRKYWKGLSLLHFSCSLDPEKGRPWLMCFYLKQTERWGSPQVKLSQSETSLRIRAMIPAPCSSGSNVGVNNLPFSSSPSSPQHMAVCSECSIDQESLLQ